MSRNPYGIKAQTAAAQHRKSPKTYCKSTDAGYVRITASPLSKILLVHRLPECGRVWSEGLDKTPIHSRVLAVLGFGCRLSKYRG